MADPATLLSPLLKCFHSVPPAAIPAMLDCVLASSNISPPLLFDSLLSSFSIVIDSIDKDTDKLLGSEQCKILVAYSRSLSHLLKNAGVYSIALESFTWKAFVPLMKMGNLYGRETLNEIQDFFLETVKMNNNWEVVKATLVPFLLRSVDISMDSLQNTSIIERSKHGSDVKFHAPVGGEDLLSVSSSFPLSISCHMLSSLLDAALQSYHVQGSCLDLQLRGGSSAEMFLRNLLWDLCDITIRMLPQSSAHRSCAVGLLFPTILNAFADVSSFEVTAGEKTFNLSRNYFIRKMWECCSVLFSLGHVERRDAYGIISLYLSYVPCVDRVEVEVVDRAEEFDITSEKQFWDEIKRGLVSKESLVRKQSLQILKKVLLIKDETHSNSNIPDKKSHHKGSVPVGMTKRDVWAEKEATSFGVGKISTALDPSLSEPQKWEAFILLYEMLEEYGTHLVEAAWNHQIVLLLNSCQQDRPLDSAYEGFGWLAILWERGLFHENPLVRCLIMESFLDIHWKNQRNLTQLFPEDFLLGPFVEGLNDPVHHKDFGVKGIYTSMTTIGASLFLQRYCSLLNERFLLSFLSKLASVAKRKSFGRAGLMALAECIYSASNCSIVSTSEKDSYGRYKSKCEMDDLVNSDGVGSLEVGTCNEKTYLIDCLRLLIEVSKQHFNPCYRLKVCEKLVGAGALVVCTHELPLEMILLFVAALPRDFIDAGPLRSQLQGWLLGCGKKDCIAGCTHNKMQLQLRLLEFPKAFLSQTYHADFLGEYDDDDIIAWGIKSERWARVLFLLIKEEPPLQALFLFLKEIDVSISQKNNSLRWIPVKFLIIMLSLVHELEMISRKADPGLKLQDESGVCLHEEVYRLEAVEASLIQISSENFLSVLEELTSFAITSCSIFWSGVVGDTVDLPGAVTGKLGGPSQRRLSSSLTTSVLQAIMSVKTAACLSSWCSRVREDVDLIVPHTFLWEFVWKTVSKPMCETETSAEIQLATYEALGSVLKALAPMFSSLTIKLIQKANGVSSPPKETMPLLDCLVLSFLTHCNKLLGSGQLARSRLAVLLNWKWLCIESLLSMPYHALHNGVNLRSSRYFFSSNVVECIFYDLVESLENAADDSALPMLRSIRLVLDMLTTDGPFLSSRCMVDVQMVWQLVRSCWILHSSCKKRRVAPISALLSSVLHASVFRDESMHVADNADGPLKWFCGKVLEEGTKSPRTIRLAALHLTGLWLLNPLMIKHYVKELKVFTLYGSVAFDEDFESELTENDDARAEVSLLAENPDPEITEVFINTELYARVSVAVLFHKLGGLAEMVGSESENEVSRVALEAGKLFLLALLDSVVNDIDLAKELYKKYSAIHRRKVRVWQMLCILSPFVDEHIIQHVMHGLHTAIHRNNLPSVRQYMESFAINLYLKFPQLVKEHLVPLLSDYHMKTQALASYVFIAANVILHASEALQSQYLEKLLPPVVPLLTSHHHTLRGFTQLLVFKVLSEKMPSLETAHFEMVPLEKKCFADLKLYLGLNPDCVRLRSSMEVFLDTFDPKHAVTPAGIFSNRVEAVEFECVSMSLMEQVINFLNDAREDLRDAMAKDDVTIKNESLKSAASLNLTNSPARQSREELSGYPQMEAPLDFQKKFTLLKHEKENDSSRSILDHLEIYKPLAELEKEDKLLVQMLQSRVSSIEKLRANRQEFILVASLIDRIPNLAGLARTCEVFKATGLVVADAKVLQDRQFQLISVTAEKWIPIVEVPVNSVKTFLEKKKREGFSILGLEQTANSIPLDKYEFLKKTVLVLGREKEGIPVDLIHILDACLEIPQLGVVRSLNVHVSGAIALWEYTRQQRAK